MRRSAVTFGGIQQHGLQESADKKSRRDEMFIDGSQENHPQPIYWQTFRS